MDQAERLDFLVEKFKEDSEEYRDLEVGNEAEEKRTILRSLMNIRMPRPMEEEILKIQDDYLRQRAEEKGILTPADIKCVNETLQSNHKYAEKLAVWQGDITRLGVSAIVNAANSQMLGCFQPMHACIDNCIHTFAGVQLRRECNRQMQKLRMQYGKEYEQPTAKPMLTPAYNLPAEYVIHVVGPIVYGSLTDRHRKELADCYQNVLDLCLENGIRSVAFCCISTGVFHFPNEEAARIAVSVSEEWLDQHEQDMDCIIFNVFKQIDKKIYEKMLI